MPILEVALRKESVDRNSSAFFMVCSSLVALRKESVDRNGKFVLFVGLYFCRSPQGERG